MPVFDMDTTETIDPYGVIKDGDYPVFVDDVELKQTQAGRDMVMVQFKIDSGDYAGRDLTYFLFLDDKPGSNFSYKINWKRLKEALDLPADGAFDSDDKTIGGVTIIGRSCFAHVRPDKEDETRPRITRLIPESKMKDESHAEF